MTVIARLVVKNDKPGRSVEVEVAADYEGGQNVILKVGGRHGESEWTWLSASEAIRVAEGLLAAAAQLRTLKAVSA